MRVMPWLNSIMEICAQSSVGPTINRLKSLTARTARLIKHTSSDIEANGCINATAPWRFRSRLRVDEKWINTQFNQM